MPDRMPEWMNGWTRVDVVPAPTAREVWRAAFDLLDLTERVARLLVVLAWVLAAWCLVQAGVAASERLNAVPLVWGAACVGWSMTAVLVRHRIAEVRERVGR